jgi:ABC-type branched-subunit amino acid transport system permease subunit
MIDHPFGGLVGILNLPPPSPIVFPGLVAVDFTTNTSYYYLTVILSLLCIVFLHRIHKSRVGLILRSIDQSDILSVSVGVNIMNYKVLAFVIGSTIAGLAGVLYAFNARSMLPGTFTFWNSIYSLIYVTVGGSGNIVGPMLGATVFTILSEVLRPAQMFEPLIFGLVLILFVVFFKNGLLGAVTIVFQSMTQCIDKFGSKRVGACRH